MDKEMSIFKNLGLKEQEYIFVHEDNKRGYLTKKRHYKFKIKKNNTRYGR